MENIEPLKVTCTNPKTSLKLIKGAIYDAVALQTRYGLRKLSLDNIGHYDCKNFEILGGGGFDNILDFSIDRKFLDIDTDYTNHLVKCKYSNSKNLKPNEIYLVQRQERFISYQNKISGQKFYDIKLKIKGIKALVSRYRFQEIPMAKQRQLKLKNLNGDNIKTGEETRKFLLYTEKEKFSILTELLTKTLIDINCATFLDGQKVNIINLILRRGKIYNILEDDLIFFMKQITPLLTPYADVIE